MDYLDFEIEIGIGTGRIYPVAVVRSAAGEARESMHFPFDELALEKQLLKLQNALLRSGGKHRQMLLPEEQTVQEFGLALFKALFSGEIGKRYVVSQLAASNQGKGLRLKLRILSPELAALPWEFLYDPGGPEYLCLSSTTPIVRYLELAQPPQPLLVTPPLSILGVISSPKDLPKLDIEREKQRLEKAIEDLRAYGLVELTWLSGQTWSHLQREMRRGPWHILHFIGHGGFDARTDEGLIALENKEGNASPLSATHLGRLLADHRSLRLVVLNSCEGAKASEHDIFSSTATVLIRRGIPAVLAMQYEITDRAAIELSHAFYEALADGLPVDTAVSEARKAMSLGIPNTLEWGTPVLYMRSLDGVLFEVKQRPLKSHEPMDRPAAKQGPSLDVVASIELPQSKPMQHEASSRLSDEVSEQEKQSADENFPSGQASSQIDTLSPSRLQVPSLDMKPCPVCGVVKLRPGAAFCSHCGHRLVHIPQTNPSVEAHVLLPLIEKSPERKADTPSIEQVVLAEERSPISSISVTKAEAFTLVDTLIIGPIGHTGQVSSVAISADGRTLVSGSGDKTIKVWNLQSGDLLRTLSGHTSGVSSVAISADGQTLVSGSGDKTIKVWNPESGDLQGTLSGHTGQVNSVAISADGKILVSGSGDKTIKVWNLQRRSLLSNWMNSVGSSPLRTLSGHTGQVNSVAISADGKTLVSGSDDETIKRWNLQSGDLLYTLNNRDPMLYGRQVNSVAISADGKILVSGSDNGMINAWNLQSGERLPLFNMMVWSILRHRKQINSVAISANGQTLVSGSGDKTIKMWNLQSGDLLRTSNDNSGASCVVISPDGQILVGSGRDKTINVWNLQSKKLLRTLSGHIDRVNSVAISADGQTLVSGSDDSTIKVWNLQSGDLLRTLEDRKNFSLAGVNSVAISIDGRTLVSGSDGSRMNDSTIKVWNLQSGDLLRTLEDHREQVNSVAISPDGQILLSGSLDSTIKVWNLQSGDLLRTLSGHTSGIINVAISPDGKTLISSSLDETIKIWNLQKGALLRTLSGHTKVVNSVAISPNGQILVSGGGDKTIKLWNLQSKKLLRTLSGHTDQINSVAISPDGQTLVSGSLDQTIKIWSTK